MAFPIRIQDMHLSVEGVRFESWHRSLVIEPFAFCKSVKLSGKPVESGKLSFKGCIIRSFNMPLSTRSILWAVESPRFRNQLLRAPSRPRQCVRNFLHRLLPRLKVIDIPGRWETFRVCRNLLKPPLQLRIQQFRP
eukprot:297617_1